MTAYAMQLVFAFVFFIMGQPSEVCVAFAFASIVSMGILGLSRLTDFGLRFVIRKWDVRGNKKTGSDS